MGEKVGKVALVGAGAMAECHVRGYHEAGAEVVAIVDRNPEAGRKFAEKCQRGKIPVVETLGELQRTAPEVQAVQAVQETAVPAAAQETHTEQAPRYIEEEVITKDDFEGEIEGEGVLEIMPDGYGFLRSADYN